MPSSSTWEADRSPIESKCRCSSKPSRACPIKFTSRAIRQILLIRAISMLPGGLISEYSCLGQLLLSIMAGRTVSFQGLCPACRRLSSPEMYLSANIMPLRWNDYAWERTTRTASSILPRSYKQSQRSGIAQATLKILTASDRGS